MPLTHFDTTAEFLPATQTELARFVAENFAGEMYTLGPVGGRTAMHFGYPAPPPAVTVAMTDLNRVLDYPARDMTITVEAGIRMDELAKLLATERQRLPIDIAQSSRATLGGAIATNTSGPRRFGCGTFRDYVIGISAVDARGRLFKAGGRVVKNVAGYDLCKLMVGSRGTLAIITQVTLKLRPLPETSALLWITFDLFSEIENVLERLLLSDARPVAVEVLNPAAAQLITAEARCELPTQSAVLCLGVEGTPKEVEWQIARLQRELAPYNPTEWRTLSESEAPLVWTALTEFQTCADDPLTFQANLLPSRCMEFADRATQLGIAVQIHAGNGLIIGQLPDEAATPEQAESLLNQLRPIARGCGGNLIVLNCDPEWKPRLPVCGEPEPAWPLMKKLKQTLDPGNLLNPGRFIDGAV